MKASSINYVLRRYRRGGAFKQKDTARLLDVRDELVSRLETGERRPTLRIAIAYEVLTGLPISELFSSLYDEYEEETVARATSMLVDIATSTSASAKSKRMSLEQCQRRAIRRPNQRTYEGERHL